MSNKNTTTDASSGGVLSYRRRQRFWEALESPYIVHLVLAIAVFSIIGPIFWEFLTSLNNNQTVYDLRYLAVSPSLQSYYDVLIERSYWKALLNTLIIASVATAVVMLLGTPAGFVFSRYRFRFDSLIFVAVFAARLFPPIGLVIPYYRIMAQLNILNTKTGIIIANVYLWLPLVIYMMRNFFIRIPSELDEAALVDGCTDFQSFRKIVLPLALPGFAASAILTFLFAWREFLFAFIVTTDLTSMPISVAAFGFIGDSHVFWASLAAACVLAIIPPLFIVFFFQRYIVSGLTGGALKQ